MRIIVEIIKLDELKKLLGTYFKDMVKAVVDIDKKIVAIDAELHSDLETLLLDQGSLQKNLWGINLYPNDYENDFIEFDSMINIRPGQGNMSRGVESETIRQKIKEVVTLRVKQ